MNFKNILLLSFLAAPSFAMDAMDLVTGSALPVTGSVVESDSEPTKNYLVDAFAGIHKDHPSRASSNEVHDSSDEDHDSLHKDHHSHTPSNEVHDSSLETHSSESKEKHSHESGCGHVFKFDITAPKKRRKKVLGDTHGMLNANSHMTSILTEKKTQAETADLVSGLSDAFSNINVNDAKNLN